MQKTKRRKIDFSDIPELTAEDWKHARRVTPAETEMYRQAIERKLGTPRPARVGRPLKDPTEKFVPISWRTPPEVKKWLIDQARLAGIGKYQKFLSMLLRGMMRYEVVREKNGLSLRLPNSKKGILIASEPPRERKA